MMHHVNLKLETAQGFVAQHHRHSKPLRRHMFSIGAMDAPGCHELHGICTVDRCSSAWAKRRNHLEIRRLCVKPDAPRNTASYLLSKARDACFAMGYDVIVTYTKPSESGASLMACGFWLQKARWVPGKPEHPKGLLQWVTARSRQATPEEMAWTKEALREIKDDNASRDSRGVSEDGKA